MSNPDIQAIWVGGSLAAGRGDQYSDIDFRIAVEPGQLDRWDSPNGNATCRSTPVGNSCCALANTRCCTIWCWKMGRFSTSMFKIRRPETLSPTRVLSSSSATTEFRKALDEFVRPISPLIREIDGAVVRQFFVDY